MDLSLHGLGWTLKNINGTGNLKFSDIFSGLDAFKILSINVEHTDEVFSFFCTRSSKPDVCLALTTHIRAHHCHVGWWFLLQVVQLWSILSRRTITGLTWSPRLKENINHETALRLPWAPAIGNWMGLTHDSCSPSRDLSQYFACCLLLTNQKQAAAGPSKEWGRHGQDWQPDFITRDKEDNKEAEKGDVKSWGVPVHGPGLSILRSCTFVLHTVTRNLKCLP